MSEKKLKVQDVLDTIKKSIESKNIAPALSMLEGLVRSIYVKLRAEDVLTLYIEQLPYEAGYNIVIITRNGIMVVYQILREREFVDRIEFYVRRL